MTTLVVGDVHAVTGCRWVNNSFTELYGVVRQEPHRKLFPPAMERGKIINGIPEDGETHDFRWYSPVDGTLQSGRGQVALDRYTADYAYMKNSMLYSWPGTTYVNFTPSGTIGVMVTHWNSGSRFSGLGEHWAYHDSTLHSQHVEVGLPGCYHVLADSTPVGHEAFVVLTE